ncbi:MAG: hypothetical protein EDX89_06890 [Acidobacteria bacterium]|nr:MAG: hypothetical protein EDX89_06890 [Acidobacteriota bacterium]MCE7958988.1 hypothetical protein [Acidobacteria bacterium ACB2]
MKHPGPRVPLRAAFAVAAILAAAPAPAASPSTPGLSPRARSESPRRVEPARPLPGRLGFADWLLEVLRGRLDTTPFGSGTGTTADPLPASDPASDPTPPSTDAVCPPERVHCPLG